MSVFVLDTDVISRTSPFSPQLEAVQTWLDENWSESFISVVTVGELWFGATRLRAKGATRKAARLSAWIEDVEHSLADRVLPSISLSDAAPASCSHAPRRTAIIPATWTPASPRPRWSTDTRS